MYSKTEYINAMTLIYQLDQTAQSDLKKLRVTTLADLFHSQQGNMEEYNILKEKLDAANAEIAVLKGAQKSGSSD